MHAITYLKLLRNYTILINIAKVMCSCHLTSKAIDYCGFSISCQFFQPSIDFGNSGVHRVVTNLLNPSLTNLLGNSAPHARTGGVLIFAQGRLSTLTQYFTWFGKSPTSTGESILLEIYRERITTYMEEEDHFTQTQLPALLLHLQLLQWQQGCCHCSSLSLHSLAHTHVLSLFNPLTLLSNNCLFYRQTWWALPAHLSTWRGQQSLKPWHELWHNSCFHLLGGGVLPQMAIS
jgi:hypothetical protein